MLNRWVVLVIVTALLGVTGEASAEDFGSADYRNSLDPAWGVGVAADGPPVRPPKSAFGSFQLGVPIVMNVDRDFVRPGATLHGEGGFDLGYVAFFLHGGFRWVPVDFDRAAKNGHPEYAGEGREPLKNPHFGFGVKAQAPNRSRAMPYVSVAFDFNWWNLNQTAVACGGYWYWWCSEYNVYSFTPGFSGKIGNALHVANGFYVDLGLDVSMTFQGDFFNRNEWWLEPYIGILHRM